MSIDREAVLVLYGGGLTALEVAAQLHVNANSVRSVIRHAQEDGDPRAAARKRNPDINAAVHAEARRRGVTAKELRETIIAIVVKDELWGALLDR